MNNDELYKAINDYQTKVYNLLIEDIDLSIIEAKKKKLNPIDTYKFIKQNLDDNLEELIFAFTATNDVPLSESIQEQIDNYIDSYLLKANEFAKSELKKEIDSLGDEEFIEVYDLLQKRNSR